MGSAQSDPRLVVIEIEALARHSMARGGAIDDARVFEFLESSLDDLNLRDELVRYLAFYIARASTGCVPDPRR